MTFSLSMARLRTMVLSLDARLNAAGISIPFRLPATTIIRGVGLNQSSFAHYQRRALTQDNKHAAYSSPYDEKETRYHIRDRHLYVASNLCLAIRSRAGATTSWAQQSASY